MFSKIVQWICMVTLFAAVTVATVDQLPLSPVACAGVVMLALVVFSLQRKTRILSQVPPAPIPVPVEDHAK